MFLGHYGLALALKRAEPKVSLGTLFLAAQTADLLWGCFLLLGWEEVRIDPGYTVVTPLQFIRYPISHSLAGAVAWGLVGGAIYYSWPTRDTSRHWQAAALVAVTIFSHYPLDVLVHVPDLPLAGQDSPKLGLGLWNHPGATVGLELLTLFAGLAVYVAFRSQRHPVHPGRIAALVLVLIAVYLGSLFGPLPPDVTTIAVGDILLLSFLAVFAGWADRSVRR